MRETTTKRMFEVVTPAEWDALRPNKIEHTDVTQAIRWLHGEPVKTSVKIQCPGGLLAHKKRMAAREQAAVRKMTIQTKHSNGWLYIRRER